VNYFFLDTSALSKRYVAEIGTPLVNHLFNTVPKQRMIASILMLGELVSILVRKKNSGHISEMVYLQVMAEFRAELADEIGIMLQSVSDDLVRASLPLIEQYSLNATDAIILRSALNVANALRAADDDLVLVTTDIRLSNAAQSTKLLVWNPERSDQSSLNVLISL